MRVGGASNLAGVVGKVAGFYATPDGPLYNIRYERDGRERYAGCFRADELEPIGGLVGRPWWEQEFDGRGLG